MNEKFQAKKGAVSTNWQMRSARAPKAYTLTEGATDVMEVEVREKIDIHGVGTDVVFMKGVFVVRRDHPRPVKGAKEVGWANANVATEFRALELYGESELFGTVRVRLNPKYKSEGVVGPGDIGSMAAGCEARLFVIIELPELGLELSTEQGVPLGSKVISIPPVGDVARSQASAILYNQSGEALGELISSDIEVGKVMWEHPLGATERYEEQEKDQ